MLIGLQSFSVIRGQANQPWRATLPCRFCWPTRTAELRVLQGYLPLLVELRTYARVRAEGKAETFVEFLAYLAEAEGYPFSGEQLESYLAI